MCYWQGKTDVQGETRVISWATSRTRTGLEQNLYHRGEGGWTTWAMDTQLRFAAKIKDQEIKHFLERNDTDI